MVNSVLEQIRELPILGNFFKSRNLIKNIERDFHKLTFSDARATEMLVDIFRDMKEGLQMADILEDITLLGDPQIASCATDILVSLRQGKSFSQSVEGWYSPTLCATLAAAEGGNDFAKTGSEVISVLLEGSSSVISDALAKVGVPVFYFLIVLGMCAYMSGEVFPVLESVVPREKWKDSTWIVYNTGNYISNYWHVTALVIVVILLAVRYALSNYSGPVRRKIDSFFGFSVYVNVQGSRVLLSMGVLMSAGESIRRTLGLIAERESPHVRWYIEQMIKRIDAGMAVAQAVDVGIFSQKEILSLRRRERQSSFGQAIIEVAKRANEQRNAGIKKLLVLPQFIFFGLDGFFILMIFDGLRISI